MMAAIGKSGKFYIENESGELHELNARNISVSGVAFDFDAEAHNKGPWGDNSFSFTYKMSKEESERFAKLLEAVEWGVRGQAVTWPLVNVLMPGTPFSRN
jgi:hypothetical protein